MSESAVPNAASPNLPDPAIDDVEALPAGTRLAEFEIKSVLGRGGFGIVYLASDLSLQRQVAIKEYLPAALARRHADGRLTVRNAAFAQSFEMGLRSFVNESRLLARFDHPALVKVHRFWEANNTAYMVMPYYQGVTLTQVRQSMSVTPSEAWLRRILTALLGALDVMHNASVFHRDVAPDNIVLLPSGLPVLLDFGAARHVLEGQAQQITALVKPAYAPIEQYAAGAEFHQGPWTDIYGVAATLHYCLTGKPPPTAAARIVDDDYEPLSLARDLLDPADGEPYHRDWLAALDWGLRVKPQDRPQSIAQWQQALESRAKAPAEVGRDRSPAMPAPRPAPDAHAPTSPEPRFVPAGTEQPAFAFVALMARAAAAPKALQWVTASMVLGVLLAGGWRAMTPAVPSAPAVASSASPARVSTTHMPAVHPAALPMVIAPRAIPALHTPKPTDHDGTIEESADVSTPAALPAPGKRKAKMLREREKAPPSGNGLRADPPRAGPQVVEARREPAWSRNAEPLPRDLCRSRGFLGSLTCMREACASPKWAKHSQCLNWNQMERRYMADSRP